MNQRTRAAFIAKRDPINQICVVLNNNKSLNSVLNPPKIRKPKQFLYFTYKSYYKKELLVK